MIQRISEAIDAELLKQGVIVCDIESHIDNERLALAAMEEIANQLSKEGFSHPARWLRSKIGEKA